MVGAYTGKMLCGGFVSQGGEQVARKRCAPGKTSRMLGSDCLQVDIMTIHSWLLIAGGGGRGGKQGSGWGRAVRGRRACRRELACDDGRREPTPQLRGAESSQGCITRLGRGGEDALRTPGSFA
jgi:hypothetical protein